MTMLLGGRAAEQVVFGSITTGASDDLKRVADIAHAMIHDYAMGTGMGPMRVLTDGSLGGDPPGPRRGDPRAGGRGPPRRAGDHRRAPGSARRARVDAAHQRGARAPGHRPGDARCPEGRAAPDRTRRARNRGRHGREARAGHARIARAGHAHRESAAQPAAPQYSPRPDALHHRPRRRGRRGHRRGAGAIPRRPRACRSCTARRSPLRASMPCCSTSATATSSCCSRWVRRPPSASSCRAEDRGCTTSPTVSTTSRRRCAELAAAGLRLIDERPRRRDTRLPRGLPAPHLDWRRPDRDRRARPEGH